MTVRKFNMLAKRSGYSQYPATFTKILESIPEELKNTCTVSQLVLIIETTNKAFQNGKNSTGASIIDNSKTDGAVFVDCLNTSIEWIKKDGSYSVKIAHPEYIED